MKLKEIPLSITFACRLKFAKIIDNQNQQNCIVSLTSIPKRLPTLHLTIKSILNQSTPPKHIALWLNHNLRDTVPSSLMDIQSEQFKIYFRDDTSSHRKLVFALEEFPSDVIVTSDDDLMYPHDWLETLMKDHYSSPKHIIAHQCREISYDKEGILKPYRQWPTILKQGYSSKGLLPIGYGGVLYPPKSLHPDTLDKMLYMALAPKADDLWFKMMGFIYNTEVQKCTSFCEKPVPIIGAKGSALAKTNIKRDGNRLQWLAICEHYVIYPSVFTSQG